MKSSTRSTRAALGTAGALQAEGLVRAGTEAKEVLSDLFIEAWRPQWSCCHVAHHSSEMGILGRVPRAVGEELAGSIGCGGSGFRLLAQFEEHFLFPLLLVQILFQGLGKRGQMVLSGMPIIPMVNSTTFSGQLPPRLRGWAEGLSLPLPEASTPTSPLARHLVTCSQAQRKSRGNAGKGIRDRDRTLLAGKSQMNREKPGERI